LPVFGPCLLARIISGTLLPSGVDQVYILHLLAKGCSGVLGQFASRRIGSTYPGVLQREEVSRAAGSAYGMQIRAFHSWSGLVFWPCSWWHRRVWVSARTVWTWYGKPGCKGKIVARSDLCHGPWPWSLTLVHQGCFRRACAAAPREQLRGRLDVGGASGAMYAPTSRCATR
jgi:hypothetical protein